MTDTNHKKTKNVFEIHTMAKDNQTKKPEVAAPQSPQKTDAKKSEKTEKKPQKKNVQEKKAVANPFLTSTDMSQKETEEQGVFPPKMDTDQDTPFANIKKEVAKDTQKESKEQKTDSLLSTEPKKQKNMVRMIMIACITLFIIGAIGVVVYILFISKNNATKNPEPTQPDTPSQQNQDTPQPQNQQPDGQIYSTVLPNYIIVNVESPTSESDIAAKLDEIAMNISAKNITEPIAFTINDSNNNPISFHIFATSAQMNIPQNILSALEESFELYAYNDPGFGVRFGLVIDVKNEDALKTALAKSEKQLPVACSLFIDTELDASAVSFSDSVYDTHTDGYEPYAIRYVNLDAQGSYSLDYAVQQSDFYIGTTKDMMRAMIMDVQASEYMPEDAVL